MNRLKADYESPEIAFILMEEKAVVCFSGNGKTENFDELEEFEW